MIKAYIDTVLQSCPVNKENIVEPQLFYKDTEGAFDDTDPFLGRNRGLVNREKYTRESRSVDMEGVPLTDICQVDRYILNGVEISFKFWQTKPQLHLMSAKPRPLYKTVIEKAVLKVCRVLPTPHMAQAHQATLNKKHLALYPYLKCEVKRFTIPRGVHDFTHDDLFQGMIPTRLFVGMVSNEALNGTYRKNPFNFKHFGVNHVECIIDGESLPTRRITCKFGDDYTDGNYMNAYMSLSRTARNGQKSHCITRAEYAQGYTFFAFNFDADINTDSEGEFWPSFKRGNLGIEIHFDHALPETVSLIACGTFPKTLKIDHTRDVIID